MDFGNTPASRTTERIMQQIAPHLLPHVSPTHHYNRVYEVVHREVLAALLIEGLVRNIGKPKVQQPEGA